MLKRLRFFCKTEIHSGLNKRRVPGYHQFKSCKMGIDDGHDINCLPPWKIQRDFFLQNKENMIISKDLLLSVDSWHVLRVSYSGPSPHCGLAQCTCTLMYVLSKLFWKQGVFRNTFKKTGSKYGHQCLLRYFIVAFFLLVSKLTCEIWYVQSNSSHN